MNDISTRISDSAHLVPGSNWTFGVNNRTGDRSWVGEVWEVITMRGDTVWLRFRGPGKRSYANVISVQFAEHAWFQADGVLDELRIHLEEASSDAKPQETE